MTYKFWSFSKLARNFYSDIVLSIFETQDVCCSSLLFLNRWKTNGRIQSKIELSTLAEADSSSQSNNVVAASSDHAMAGRQELLEENSRNLRSLDVSKVISRILSSQMLFANWLIPIFSGYLSAAIPLSQAQFMQAYRNFPNLFAPTNFDSFLRAVSLYFKDIDLTLLTILIYGTIPSLLWANSLTLVSKRPTKRILFIEFAAAFLLVFFILTAIQPLEPKPRCISI